MTTQRKHRKISRRVAKARLTAIAEPPPAPGTEVPTWVTAVRRHPWSSLAVGVGVGVVLGMSPKLRNQVLMSLLNVAK